MKPFWRYSLHLAIIVIINLFKHSCSLEWVVDDAIYIAADIETRSPGESTSKNGSTALNENDHFPSKSILPGRCTKLKDCYPLLFLSALNDPHPSPIHSNLADFILETSDVCEPIEKASNGSTVNKGGRADQGDVYIWCKVRRGLDKTNTKVQPAIVGTKAESEDSVCGTVKTRLELDNDLPEQRVVGGKVAFPGQAPYVVAMTFRGKQVCGASIIDSSYVLTAAHCVSHLKPAALSYLKLLIGDHDISDPNDVQHQERNVSKIIYHKEFSTETLHDDIAMIRLEEPIEYTSNVEPVCLSDGTPPYDDGSTQGTLVGWGQISDTGPRPLTLRTADLRIWKQDDCEEAYEGIAPEDIIEKAFCAGGLQDGGTTDACRGDSGGPLTIKRNNRVEQAGIVSFGVGCGRYPGVFTRVNEYLDWIDRHKSLVFDFE